jgi:hypothetical protein
VGLFVRLVGRNFVREGSQQKRYSARMVQHSILKKKDSVTINHVNGHFESLHAEKFTVEANHDTATLSFDLSYNQRTGKQTNTCDDVAYLLKHLDTVDLIQMSINKVSKELGEYNSRYPKAKWTLEMLFADGVKRSYPGELNPDFDAFTVHLPECN